MPIFEMAMYNDSLLTLDQGLALYPNDSMLWNNKGYALFLLWQKPNVPSRPVTRQSASIPNDTNALI